MNVQQKVQTLEALLSRVKKNASSPRAARTVPAMAAVVAPLVADASTDNDLPPELAHAVFAPPASRRHEEPAPDSKPRLVALAPPLATAGRAPAAAPPPRSPTPAYGISAQTPEAMLGAKSVTPKAPAVAPAPTPKPTRVEAKTSPPPAKPATRPEPAKPAPPAVKAPAAPPPPVFAKPAPQPVKPAAAAAVIPHAAAPAGRAGARTLMGTGLGEVRAAIAQAEAAGPSAPPPAVVPKVIADETTGEGETLIKRSPLFDEPGEGEDESTRLMPQPTQEELIAASESFAKQQAKVGPAAGAAPRVIVQQPVRADAAPVPVIAAEDSTGDGETLIKESPLAATEASPKPPALSPKPPPALPTPMPAAIEPMAAASPAMDLPAMAAAEMPAPMAEPSHQEVSLAEGAPPAPPMAPRPLSEPPMAEAGPPSVPSFLRPGSVRPAPGDGAGSRFATGAPPVDAPLPPPKKRGVASMFGVGLAAAALFAAGGFLAMRGGWIEDFAGVRGHATSAPSAKPTPMPTASSGASAAATTSAASASAEPAPAPAPAPTASATATASAEPAASAAPSAAAGDPSALPRHKGFLVVKSDKTGDVYMNGHLLGKAGEPITVDCGIRFIRLGNAGANANSPTYIGAGRSVNIACRNTTETTLPGPVGREPAGPAPDGAPPAPAPAPPSPEL